MAVPSTLDLRTDVEFTFALMDDRWVWRHRAVEALEVGLADHVTVATRYHFELPPELVAAHVRRHRQRSGVARVLLPVTVRPKRPLLGFTATGPGGSPAHLLLRTTIARLEAGYARGFIEPCDDPHVRETLSEGVLGAIARAAPAVIDYYEAERGGDRLAGLAAYVREGIGVELSRGEVGGLLERQRGAAELLAGAVGQPVDAGSAAENVLLALPYLPDEERPRDAAGVADYVVRYADAIESEELGDPVRELIAAYGRRWEMLVEVDVPLDEPFTVQLREERPVQFGRRRAVAHDVLLHDAQSYHVEVRVVDPSVRIAPRPALHDAAGRSIGVPNLEGARETPEFFAFYSSEPDRPARGTVWFRLRPVELIRWTSAVVEALTWLAVLAAVSISGDDHVVLGALGVVVIPTTFVVALLLVREQTPAAARVLRWHKRRILAALAVLWLVTLLRVTLWIGVP